MPKRPQPVVDPVEAAKQQAQVYRNTSGSRSQLNDEPLLSWALGMAHAKVSLGPVLSWKMVVKNLADAAANIAEQGPDAVVKVGAEERRLTPDEFARVQRYASKPLGESGLRHWKGSNPQAIAILEGR